MNDDRPDNQNSEPLPLRAFEKFYRAHYDDISRYVARRVSHSAHDEVVGATFIVAWRKYGSVSNPSLPWLYRIANYEVAHECRRIARQPEVAELHDLNLTDNHSLEDVIDISTAFVQLSPGDAELLRLVHWEQLSRAEVAEVLGCSVNATNVRYHRALERLSSTLHRLSNAPSGLSSTNEEPKENQ
jgi:RNA polymerase sigma factor (sigma-70 family)